MANILSLAMKISADASGVPKGLTPAERALEKLGAEAAKSTDLFKQFANGSEAASKAALQSATDFAFLASALRTNQITPQQYAEEFAKLREEAQGSADAFKEGARIQAQYGNAQKIAADETARLFALYQKGAIDLDALNAASIAALGIDEQASQSAQRRSAEFGALQREAASIREANLTAQELFDRAIARAAALREEGILGAEDFNRELERQAAILAKSIAAADGFGKSVNSAVQSGLKFNEISGILAALPGPLGNIAGRFSGIASAAEGLGRVFNGGLNSGISTLASQFSSLLTPANVAVGAFAAAAAGSAALVRGLSNLEGQVEQLGNAALRLGTDFQAIQVLNEAAARSGVAIDALASGIQRLAVNINETRSGTGKAAEAFRELGISQEQLATLDPATLAQQTAEALQRIEDPAKRAALATETLGKAGLTLLPGFNAIAESEAALRRFSAAISDVDRDRIGSLGQAFDNVKTAIAGLGQSALLPFAGVVDGVSRLFADLVGTITRVAQAIGFVLTPVLDGLGFSFRLLSDGLSSINGLFDYLTGSNRKATAEVQALRAEIEDPLEAGFVKEFASDLERINTGLRDAINESAAFGQAGFDAALRYQESIRQLQKQLDDGIINEEVFRRSAEQAGNAFRDEIARIEQDAKLEIQVTESAAQAVASIRAELSKAIDESAALGQAGFDAALQYQNAVEELQRQFEAGIINEEALARGAQAAKDAYEAQVDSVKKLVEEQQKLIENDRERIDALLQSSDAAAKIEQDLLVVQREQARVSEELAAARAADNVAQADAAAARQGELDQLQAKLEEQQQALAQGFDHGFQAAFDNVNASIDGLIEKSQQFGQAGFDAAVQLQQGIAAAQEQASAGILNEEAFNREVQRQQELYNQELQNLADIEKAKEQAAENRIKAEQQAAEAELKAREQYAQDVQKAQEQYAQQQQKALEAYAQEQQRIYQEQQKAAEAEAKRQEERLRKLNTLGQQSVGVGDVRTQEGAALVLNLAANAQDPAMIQARLQTKYLERIALGIGQAASNYFNQPVAIVGYSRIN
jgi:hypothetical protein